eukprot:EG_transcript_1054
MWAVDAGAAARPRRRRTRDSGRLPIEDYRAQILEHVAQHRVAFIQGDTGCGKSSMVPQFLHFEDPSCRIWVTQPRRLAAISLCHRVADQVGAEAAVGYRLGQRERREGPDTRITFCTTGYLLAYLSHNPQALKNIKYLILDEIHERTLDSDLLLLLVKLLLPSNPHLHVIIMSATMQPAIFSEYFANFHPDLEPLVVGQKRFPVTDVFLEDLPNHLPELRSLAAIRECTATQNVQSSVLTVAMQEIIGEVVTQLASPETCILVFLPGIGEIETIQDLLRKKRLDVPLQILPLHSLIPMQDQDQAIAPALPGHCKVVLSTNIAESSVTIPDAVYVVDSGLRRGIYIDERTGRPALLCRWASQASSRQRAGRIGRVAPGTAFYLFSQSFFRALKPYDDAEIDHCSLEKTIITTKLTLAEYGNVYDLLAMVITPPDPKRIKASIEMLHRYGALTSAHPDAGVTLIGQLTAHLPFEVPLVRLLFFGHLFGRLPQTVVIAAALAQQDLFVMPSRMTLPGHAEYAEAIMSNFKERTRMDGGTYSEAIAGLRLYVEWLDHHQTCISPARARAADIAVADMCYSLQERPVLPLSEETLASLRTLARWAKGGTRHGESARDLLLRGDLDTIYFILAAGGAPNFLSGQTKPGVKMEPLLRQKGLDVRNTVYLLGLPHECPSALHVQAMLYWPQLPDVRPRQIVVLSDNEWNCLKHPAQMMRDVKQVSALVEFFPNDQHPKVHALHDMNFSCKLLLHLYTMNRGKLVVLNSSAEILQRHKLQSHNAVYKPEFFYLKRDVPVWREALATEPEINSLQLTRTIRWAIQGTNDVTAIVNNFSPLARVSDLDFGSPNWTPFTAVAFALLGSPNQFEVYATGVTILPSVMFGAVMQVLLARTVTRVLARLMPPATPGQRGLNLRIKMVEVDYAGTAVMVATHPYLTQTQWDLINKTRYYLSMAIMGDTVAAEAQLGCSGEALIQAIFRSVRDTPPPPESHEEVYAEETGYGWYYVVVPKSDFQHHYLPPLAVTSTPPKPQPIRTEEEEMAAQFGPSPEALRRPPAVQAARPPSDPPPAPAGNAPLRPRVRRARPPGVPGTAAVPRRDGPPGVRPDRPTARDRTPTALHCHCPCHRNPPHPPPLRPHLPHTTAHAVPPAGQAACVVS